MGLSGAEIAVRALERCGVEAAFGLPGSFILPLYDVLERSGIHFVSARHEQGAALMAEGYALAAGRPALCLATAGPGATNLVTGLACALADSQPVVAVTGQVPAAYRGRGALQEATGERRTVDQVALLGQVCKGSWRVTAASDVEAAVIRAHHLAVSGRPGPVHLEIAIDVLNDSAPWQGLALPEISAPAASTLTLAQAAERILAAREPVIIAGGGAMGAAVAGLVAQLAEALSLPVATTLKGKGALPEDHPLSLGCLGLFGHNAANRYLRAAPDLFIVLGAALGEFTTQCWDEALAAIPIMRFDLDREPLPEPYRAALEVPGDVAENLRRLLPLLPRRPQADAPDRLARLAALKAECRHFNEDAALSEGLPLRPERLMAGLRATMPPETVVFSESVTWTERYLPCLRPGTHLVGTGMAPIGFALPAAIGAALARRGEPVVAVMGDGGFQLGAFELLTAAHYGLRVVALVLNNGRYASIHDAQTFLFGGRHVASELPPVDFPALAAALGVASRRIEGPEGIECALTSALAEKGPVLVEAVVDPEARPPMKPRYLHRTRAWKQPAYSDSPAATQAIVRMLKEA